MASAVVAVDGTMTGTFLSRADPVLTGFLSSASSSEWLSSASTFSDSFLGNFRSLTGCSGDRSLRLPDLKYHKTFVTLVTVLTFVTFATLATFLTFVTMVTF